MDSEAVNQFIKRAGERTRILGDLDTSIMSDANESTSDTENNENDVSGVTAPTVTTPVKQDVVPSFKPVGVDDIRDIDDSISSRNRSPMKDVNTSESVSPMKSKWARLSEANREFEVEMPKKKDPAPVANRRISMTNDTSAASFFAPKIVGVVPNTPPALKEANTSIHSLATSSTSNVSSVNNSPCVKTTVVDSSVKITTSTPNRVAGGSILDSSIQCSPVTVNTSYTSVTESFDVSREAVFSFGRKVVSEQPNTAVIVEAKEPSVPSLNSSVSSNVTLSKVDVNKSVDSNADHQYGRKVDNLRKMFDKNDSNSSINSVDNAPTNFLKSRAIFESPGKAAAAGRYESPMTARRDVAVTNVRRYGAPHVPSKKPASCEIVEGPTFSASVNYWKDRVRQNPGSDDIVDAACNIFGNPNKRDYNPPKKVFFGQGTSSISPEPKRAFILENAEVTEHQTVDELDSISEHSSDEQDAAEERSKEEAECDSDDGSIVTMGLNTSHLSEKACMESLVVTESFEAIPVACSSSDLVAGGTDTVASDSFDFKRPLTPPPATTSVSAVSTASSLLDDINNDFNLYKETHAADTTETDTNSSQSASGKPALAHTLSFYRRNENHSTPVALMNSNSDVVKRLQRRNPMSDMMKAYTEKELAIKVQLLETRINSCEAAVMQSRRALEHARSTKSVTGSTEEIECIRMITVNQERQRACAMEISRIRDYQPLTYFFPRATLQFRDISLMLNPIEEIRDEYDIFIVLRYQEEVIVSRNINITRELMNGERYLNICDHLDIPSVSPDFNISFEVYCIRYRRVEQGEKKAFSLKRMIQSPAPERSAKPSVPDTFSRVGQVILTSKDMKSKTIFYVSRKHPLGECCSMRITGNPTDIDETKWEGFLSLYRIVDYRGVWEFYYAIITDGYIKMWRYPEDVPKMSAVLVLNIRDMYAPVVAVNTATIGFQFDFNMQLYDSHDTVVNMRFSAAKTEERDSVIEHINRSFKFVNTWRI